LCAAIEGFKLVKVHLEIGIIPKKLNQTYISTIPSRKSMLMLSTMHLVMSSPHPNFVRGPLAYILQGQKGITVVTKVRTAILDIKLET
jgi:hypothetical protein